MEAKKAELILMSIARDLEVLQWVMMKLRLASKEEHKGYYRAVALRIGREIDEKRRVLG